MSRRELDQEEQQIYDAGFALGIDCGVEELDERDRKILALQILLLATLWLAAAVVVMVMLGRVA